MPILPAPRASELFIHVTAFSEVARMQLMSRLVVESLYMGSALEV